MAGAQIGPSMIGEVATVLSTLDTWDVSYFVACSSQWLRQMVCTSDIYAVSIIVRYMPLFVSSRNDVSLLQT